MFILSCLFLSVGLAIAQTTTISGTVVDDTGEAVIGASVVVKGTTVGTITDVEGKYTVNVPSGGKTFVVTLVGMKTTEVDIAPNLRIVMEPDTELLDEVMVVAYGTANKKAFAGSATSVSAKQIEKKSPTEISKALAGEVAGVQVSNTSGQPGTNATIRIRGFGSVNSSKNPLYVVDGVPFSGDLSSLDPSDIATTTVLKDATATSLYGSRGANGVILITTKKGNSGADRIDVDLKYGVNVRWIPLYDVITNPEQYMELTWEGLRNRYVLQGEANPAFLASANMFSSAGIESNYNMWNTPGANLIDPATGKFNSGITRKYTPEKWDDYIFRTGHRTEATIKLSGGSQKTSYFTSFGYLKDEGYYMESDFDRFSVRSNIDYQPKSWLKGNVNLAYSYHEMNSPGQNANASNNGFEFVNSMPPIFPVFARDAEGNRIKDEVIGGYLYDYGMAQGNGRPYSPGINPAGAVKLDQNRDKAHNFTGTMNFVVDFTKDLKFTLTGGAQYLGTNNANLTNPYYGDAKGLGRVEKEQLNLLVYTVTEKFDYQKTFDNVHNFDAFIAHESTDFEVSVMGGQKSKIARPSVAEWSNAVIMGSMSSYTYGYAMESYFGQARYNYDDKYFLHATFRRDGTSRFKGSNKWGNFASVGVAWLLTREDFMASTSDWLNLLKFKASYGAIGNQALVLSSGVADYYPIEDLYTVSNLNDGISIRKSYKGQEDLTWERSNQFNTGIEFNINNVFDGEIEYFHKKTTDMLFFKQVAPSLGYSSIPVNEGEMVNQGLEMTFNVKAINTNDIKLDFRLNASHYTNKITEMPLDGRNLPKEIEVRSNAFAFSKGRSIYDYFMRDYVGVDPTTGQSKWVVYYDVKDNGEKVAISNLVDYKASNKNANIVKEETTDYNEATLDYIGKSAIPKLIGGFGFDLNAYGFDLSASFTYGLGGYGYDNVYATLMGDIAPGQRGWHKDMLDRWQKEGDVTSVPRLTSNTDKYDTAVSSRFITSNSYLNLSNVRLGYTIPKKVASKLLLNNLNVWVSGDNLFMFTKRKGYTPMTSEAGISSINQYLPLSTVMAGVKFQF